jgi:hypothetical protein
MSAVPGNADTLSEWVKAFSEKHATHYWYNKRTSESQWTKPPGWIEPMAVKCPCADRDERLASEDPKGNDENPLWVQHFSRTHGNASYWVNSKTGENRWSKPDDVAEDKHSDDVSGRASKRARVEETVAVRGDGVKIAVIVPFRDNHPEQKRSEHLASFVPALSE